MANDNNIKIKKPFSAKKYQSKIRKDKITLDTLDQPLIKPLKNTLKNKVPDNNEILNSNPHLISFLNEPDYDSYSSLNTNTKTEELKVQRARKVVKEKEKIRRIQDVSNVSKVSKKTEIDQYSNSKLSSETRQIYNTERNVRQLSEKDRDKVINLSLKDDYIGNISTVTGSKPLIRNNLDNRHNESSSYVSNRNGTISSLADVNVGLDPVVDLSSTKKQEIHIPRLGTSYYQTHPNHHHDTYIVNLIMANDVLLNTSIHTTIYNSSNVLNDTTSSGANPPIPEIMPQIITQKICHDKAWFRPAPFHESTHYEIKVAIMLAIALLAIIGNVFVLYSIGEMTVGDVKRKIGLKKNSAHNNHHGFNHHYQSVSQHQNQTQTTYYGTQSIQTQPQGSITHVPTNDSDLTTTNQSTTNKGSRPSIYAKISERYQEHKSVINHKFKMLDKDNSKAKKGKYLHRAKLQKIMFHLCIADILFSLINFSDAIWVMTTQWLGGNAFCKLYHWFKLFIFYASSLIVTVISLDRCLSIVFPMQMVANEKITKTMLISVWITAVIASFPQFLIYHKVSDPAIPECERLFNITIDEFSQCLDLRVTTPPSDPLHKWIVRFYYPLTCVIQFIFPLLATLVCYILIIVEIMSMKKKRKLEAKYDNEIQMSYKRGNPMYFNKNANNNNNEDEDSNPNPDVSKEKPNLLQSLWTSIISPFKSTCNAVSRQRKRSSTCSAKNGKSPKKRSSMDQAKINTIQVAFYAATSFIITAGPYYTSYFIDYFKTLSHEPHTVVTEKMIVDGVEVEITSQNDIGDPLDPNFFNRTVHNITILGPTNMRHITSTTTISPLEGTTTMLPNHYGPAHSDAGEPTEALRGDINVTTSAPAESQKEHHINNTYMEYIHTMLLLFFHLNPLIHVLIYGFLMKEVRESYKVLLYHIKRSLYKNCFCCFEIMYLFNKNKCKHNPVTTVVASKLENGEVSGPLAQNSIINRETTITNVSDYTTIRNLNRLGQLNSVVEENSRIQQVQFQGGMSYSPQSNRKAFMKTETQHTLLVDVLL